MQNILPALFLFLASAAHANWVFLTGSASGDQFFVDPDSRMEGTHPRVWVLGDYAKALVVDAKNSSILSTKDLQEADCAEGKLHSLSVIAYSSPRGDGKVVHTDNEPKPWVYAVPGSINGVLLRYLCDK